MTPRSPLTLALLLTLTASLAPAARAADADPPSDSGSFGPGSPGWTAADQEDADLGAAMRAAMDKTSSPTSPNSTASNDKGAASQAPAQAPTGQPGSSEMYGPPLPPEMAARVKAAGLTPTPDNPLGLAGADSPTSWATKQANDQTTQLLANRGSNGSGTRPASAAPRARSNANGNGGLQNGGTGANGSGTPGAGAGNGSGDGDSGPAVVSAAAGSILDVNDPSQMGEALATFAGVQKFDENFAALRKTAAPLTKTADASLGTDLPEDVKAAPKVICDHVSGRAQFDGGSDGAGCIQVQDPWKGIRNPTIKGA